jgi:phytanoyl-CoA hydroxylase
MLTKAQVEQYREEGYLVVEGVLDRDALAGARREVERVVAEAAKVAANDDIYDLEDSHSPQNPRVRRLKSPHRFFPVFDALTRSPAITARIAALLGPDIRLHGSKLNMKAAGYGSPVEWHQDWAFYPHTNDDVLATGLYLDDCDEANGPLMVVPGSHKGPTWDHHAEGYFCGAMDPDACAVDFAAARPLTGPAGSMTIHHVRAVHGSALNRSNRMRRLLLHEYAAADAWPLIYGVDYGEYSRRLVAGEPSPSIRLTPTEVKMPHPVRHAGSIYNNQRDLKSRFFDASLPEELIPPSRQVA